jgi:hypothetical protein
VGLLPQCPAPAISAGSPSDCSRLISLMNFLPCISLKTDEAWTYDSGLPLFGYNKDEDRFYLDQE